MNGRIGHRAPALHRLVERTISVWRSYENFAGYPLIRARSVAPDRPPCPGWDHDRHRGVRRAQVFDQPHSRYARHADIAHDHVGGQACMIRSAASALLAALTS